RATCGPICALACVSVSSATPRTLRWAISVGLFAIAESTASASVSRLACARTGVATDAISIAAARILMADSFETPAPIQALARDLVCPASPVLDQAAARGG